MACPGTATHWVGSRPGLDSSWYVRLESASQQNVTLELVNIGGRSTSSGTASPLARTITEVGVLLTCMVTTFEGYEKLANVPLRVPAVRRVNESLVVGRNPLMNSTLSPPLA